MKFSGLVLTFVVGIVLLFSVIAANDNWNGSLIKDFYYAVRRKSSTSEFLLVLSDQREDLKFSATMPKAKF